jgi:putative CocE/NonD family hydrolase
MTLRYAFFSIAAAVLYPAMAFGFGQQTSISGSYTKTEHLVPMRDGIRLYTQVYTPESSAESYPILFTRTPYGVGNYKQGEFRRSLGPSAEFAAEGYIFVYQDVRGKYRSEGEFIHHPPYIGNKSDPRDVDESSDAYDTIEWLLEKIPNHNGKVGMWGISAAGYTTAMGMIDAHPALAAASPQASPGDQFIGDDYHHYGAFRLMYAFGWTSRNARIRTGPTESGTEPFRFGTPDGYRFFLELGPLSNVNKNYFRDQVPTWNEFVAHPDYDEYWQGKNVMKDLRDIDFAVLNVIGWFDAEDYYGPWEIYRSIEKWNRDNKSMVVVGPWRHGGWSRSAGDRLGNIRFDSNTSEYFRGRVQLPFFNYYLKGEGDFRQDEAIVFETGSNEWKSYDRWPPREAAARSLYLRSGGRLSFSPPGDETGFDSYISDPDKPVPYTAEIRTSQGHEWMVEDQRFAASRPDVLVYESEILGKDLTIAGPIIASLSVTTTGRDADWIVKLIDVYPGDFPDNRPNPGNVRMGHFQMLLAGDVFRGKYRNSFSRPEPMSPGEVTKIEFDLLDKCHTFRKGHRIMVQIQSTWFPLIDRNPQDFVNIFTAQESDFQRATHRVFRSSRHSSHLKLFVIE